MKNSAFILKTCLVMLLAFVGMAALASPEFLDILGSVAGMGGISYALVTPVSIARASNEQRSPNQIKNRLWYITADQVDDTVNFPTPNALREIGSIPLKTNEFWHYLDIIKDTANPKTTVNNTDFAYEINKNIEFYLGGNEVDLLNLLEEGIGQDFFIVYENCGTGEMWLLGTNCKPLTLEDMEEFSLESLTGWRVLFESMSPKLKYKYTGTLPTQTPTAIADDATSAALDGSEQYQFGSNALATVFTTFTGATSQDVDDVIDLLGAATTPTVATTIEAGNDFLLADGATWTANPGSRISFRIFKDGAATYKFIEVAGTRIQT